MSNISDSSGRALEYKIVDAILNELPDSLVLGNTNLDQSRDKLKYDDLDDSIKTRFSKNSLEIVKWLKTEFSIDSGKLSVERLPDSAAKQGDVTDIRLQINDKEINLSIKHNHSAVKHQRPPTTALRCGYAVGSVEDIEFRTSLNEIFKKFLMEAKELKADAKLFKELKDIDSSFIDTELYLPICTLVSETVNKLCINKKNVDELFKFLIGVTNYHKLIVNSQGVSIYKFADLGTADNVVAKIEGNSYVVLNFSNGWKISMRLHTASSRLGTSVKFDSQPIDLESYVPVEKIVCI